MVATPFSICNLALANIRVPAISSFTDGTTESDTCKQVYDEIYEQALGAHRWRFAMLRVKLPQLAIAMPHQWSQAFQIPADCLMIHTVRAVDQNDNEEEDPIRWDRFQDKIVTQLPENVGYQILLDYTRRIVEANLPPYFREYLVAKLQISLSGSITGKSEYVDGAKQDAEIALRKARLKDSQGRTPPRNTPSRFVSYR